jgi:hypothetical protein
MMNSMDAPKPVEIGTSINFLKWANKNNVV